MKKRLFLKKIFIVALSLLFVFSIFNVGKVLADAKVFKLLDAKIDKKSNNTDARLMSYDEATAIGCDEYQIDSCPEYVGNTYYWLGSALMMIACGMSVNMIMI